MPFTDDQRAFIYEKEDPSQTMDPDKASYAKAKRPDLEMEDDSIVGFSGEYKFMSPLHRSPVQLPGDPTRTYPTLEHALAASKVAEGGGMGEGAAAPAAAAAAAAAKDAILAEPEPVAAKALGSKALKRGGERHTEAWRSASLPLMAALLRDKFRRGNPKYRERLLATGHRRLEHRNDYNDQYWGTVFAHGSSSAKASKGSNHLGRLLAEVRAEARRGEDIEAWLESHFSLLGTGKGSSSSSSSSYALGGAGGAEKVQESDLLWEISVTRVEDAGGGKGPQKRTKLLSDSVRVEGKALIFAGKLQQCEVRLAPGRAFIFGFEVCSVSKVFHAVHFPLLLSVFSCRLV